MDEEESPVVNKRKKSILITITVICSAIIASYLIYNLAGGNAISSTKKADALLKEKRYEEAISFYSLALQKKPKFTNALVGIGSALDSIGRSAEAINYFDEAIKINPKLAKAWNYKGSALYTLGKLDQALQCYDQALQINPKYSSPWANKASVLKVLGKYEDAMICLDNYINLEAKGLKFEITPQLIEEIVGRISPEIEKVTGSQYKNKIQVKLITPHEMESITKRNLVGQLGGMFPLVDMKDIESQAQSMSELYSAVICGRYDFIDKILYIVPDNFQMDIVLLKINKSKIKPLLDLLVGHELVHALQDQQFNIGTKMLAFGSVDEKQIFDCVIEGHAVYTIEQVAQNLKIDKEIAELSNRVSAGDLQEASPFERMAEQYVSSLFNQTYLKGREFVKFVWTKEGRQGIEKLFSNFPKQLSTIIRPQTYYDGSVKEINYTKVLGTIGNAISDTAWQKQGVPIQEISLRNAMVPWVSPKKLEEALIGFEEGFMLVYVKENSLISAVLLRFKNNSDADNFYKINNDSIQTQWDMIRRNQSMSIKILQNKKFSIPTGRKAIIKEAEILSYDGQKTHPVEVLVTSENFILDISFINCEIGEEKIKGSVSSILEELKMEIK